MSHRKRVVVELALAMAILVPVTAAQKPTGPPPTPPPQPSAPPSIPSSLPPLTSQPSESTEDLVMFLRGHVSTGDGTATPHDVMVERVCNLGVRQQVYASPSGDFSMQLGSRTDSFLDASASGERTTQSRVSARDSAMGISRRELSSCELRASASGFHSGVKNLMEIDVLNRSIDVGVLVVQRASKVEGMTISATPYKAPPDARKAYEKGLQAVKNGKLPNARKSFETAVAIYPRFAHAWFELGTVLQKENQKDAAREAYLRAATIDYKFLPPYLSLATMAFDSGDWTEVLNLTGHIVDLDPWNHANVSGYVVDFDPVNYTEIYYYDAFANYKLNRIEEAEKKGLKAEHYLDVGTRFPQLHLLMAEIYTRKKNYSTAIFELRTFLELGPHSKDADAVREQLAKLQKLNASVSASEKTDQN